MVGYPLQDVLRVEKNTPSQPEGGADGGQQALRQPEKPNLEQLILHNEAVSLARQGMFEAALAKEKQAHQLNPDAAAVRATLGSIYNSIGVEKKNGGDLEGALQQLGYALRYAPDEPQIKKNAAVVYVEMARLAIGKNDFRQGQALLDSAMEHDQRNPHLYVYFGRIAYLGNNYPKAEQDWSRALELDPGLSDVRRELEKLRREKKLEEGFEIRERDNFSIKFESLHNRDLADSLMQVLRDAYREIGRDFDLYPDSPVPVIVYPEAGLGELEYFPDWAAGTYDGKIRFGEDVWKRQLHMKAVLYHEYTHVLVRMAAGSGVPFWLNEGLAEYEAGKFKTPRMIGGREKLLRNSKRLFSLSELSGLNSAALSKLPPDAVELAYAQSEAFTKWLIEQYSFKAMRSLLIRLGRQETIEAAVRSELNEELANLEEKWLAKLHASF